MAAKPAKSKPTQVSQALPLPIVLKTIQKTLYPIDAFTPDPENARGHDEANLQAIANSIKQFGQRIPILVEANNVIRKGNGTWLAMKRLGKDRIWAIPLELDGPVAAAFALADNRAAELAHWEWQTVQKILLELQQAGQDISQLGFTDYELEPLLKASWQPPKIEDIAEPDQDPSEPICSVKLSLAQYEVISGAITRLREKQKDPDITEGQALVMICERWSRR